MSHEVTVGLEIHQQLDTRKLFCDCPSCLVEEEGASFQRRLRPTQSEMGEIDRAALAQAERKMRFRYQAPPSASCLVDADEEPPHAANAEAVELALTVAALVEASPVDEIHFMRKLVIDGSNTTGFQRTAMVAMDGFLEVNGRRISIASLCLEEDAARKVETSGSEITYRLDRLGIPLIEIATGPDMHSPDEVKEVAQRLGSIMRATRKVKRGIGTIREDINISIPGGARVEIKGVQELRMLPIYVEKEMERQRSLLSIRDILQERGVGPAAVESIDITSTFDGCTSKVISGALKSGGKVLASKLPGFAGVLRSADGRLRLGAEMAQRARTRGVKGIFHSDELPAYGIGQEYVDAVRQALGSAPGDAFVLCAADEAKARNALEAAVERANEALVGVPEETRDPQPDGSSTYSRPLPGAARMYPETDVPPIAVPAERMDRIRANLPELPEARTKRIAADYGIHEQQARQLVREGWDDVFEEIAADREMAALAARTLTSTLSELERDVDISRLDEAAFKAAFAGVSAGKFAKEAMPDVLRKMAEGKGVDDAVKELGLSAMSVDEAREIVAKVVREREAFVREKGMGAVGPLMGPVMAELRGRLDGKAANELLREELKKLLS
ncbi:MAG: Glu-tRNA(Gln) amidotransferase subunit GatE [Methanomassiliicoccaceae archaeon]|jgi:glutamyl-tRNA(Gln) amidotransferase subunit E|nr:Glu-tRNA(Gln) amidotransferase subunit GatE [Euryarchaeota archaeon]HOB38908.1 Glu-tRNA(Gln) amidotransferase subunit GatE [Methanomassiliicoccaceae archaeon]HOQ25931.1 Glu-tRNA(Gln) amidotransferase subunit GatE [Methanomassiliicoccaceae archaeon]HQA21771.1 Glu-tRNA(Gln) amidotransferase subunit GatE [Methanomassiliicoccaceae archaeon]HQD88443.1 Glu-tRNA(Gln) amidotransferase subunit GatE [Methanomassiliicoccaceae archaeon]